MKNFFFYVNHKCIDAQGNSAIEALNTVKKIIPWEAHKTLVSKIEAETNPFVQVFSMNFYGR